MPSTGPNARSSDRRCPTHTHSCSDNDRVNVTSPTHFSAPNDHGGFDDLSRPQGSVRIPYVRCGGPSLPGAGIGADRGSDFPPTPGCRSIFSPHLSSMPTAGSTRCRCRQRSCCRVWTATGPTESSPQPRTPRMTARPVVGACKSQTACRRTLKREEVFALRRCQQRATR